MIYRPYATGGQWEPTRQDEEAREEEMAAQGKCPCGAPAVGRYPIGSLRCASHAQKNITLLPLLSR